MEGTLLRRPCGVARHVSADGCQFVLEQGSLRSGQRIAFTLEGVGTIRGAVRWRVADRIGLAFEDALRLDQHRALAAHGRAVRQVQFELMA